MVKRDKIPLSLSILTQFRYCTAQPMSKLSSAKITLSVASIQNVLQYFRAYQVIFGVTPVLAPNLTPTELSLGLILISPYLGSGLGLIVRVCPDNKILFFPIKSCNPASTDGKYKY